MPLLTYIPPRYEDGFKTFASLSNDDFEAIKKGLDETTLSSSIEYIAGSISMYTTIKEEDVSKMLESVGSLIPYLANEEEIPIIASDIVTVIEKNEIAEISEKNKEGVVNNLAYLLGNKKIFTAYKSNDLLNNYGNKFIECRIVSDIRPVFNLNVEETPEAGIILHNLQIHYQSNDEPYHKDISLVLDSMGMFLLKEAIERAELKEEVLNTMLVKSGMKNLNE